MRKVETKPNENNNKKETDKTENNDKSNLLLLPSQER